MITLKINPENYLVHHDGIGDDLMLRVEPKTFGVRITLKTREANERDEKLKDEKDQALFGLVQQASTLVPALLGVRPAHGPCAGCGDKGMIAAHAGSFEVRAPDGTGVTFEPGIYMWRPGQLPTFVSALPKDEDGDDGDHGPH